LDTYRHWPKRPIRHNPQGITYAREQAGLTKTSLAKMCGVSVSLISELESGTRNATPAMLNRLTIVLGCPRSILERATPPNHTENPNAHRPAHHAPGKLNITRAEAEAFIRFAAEFLSRAKWSPATPEELEAAYLATIPADAGHENLHIHMQDLGDHVRATLTDDFSDWAYRQSICLPSDA
jgi:transcriptional regulator with XRE-family HTH domain